MSSQFIISRHFYEMALQETTAHGVGHVRSKRRCAARPILTNSQQGNAGAADDYGLGLHASKGEEIPIETRIIGVAAVYDAMISDRPYCKGIPPIEGRDAILRGAGTVLIPRW